MPARPPRNNVIRLGPPAGPVIQAGPRPDVPVQTAPKKAVRIPIPFHCQDTSLHCGFACATMLLDWLKRGRAYSLLPIPGSHNLLTDLSQILMHGRHPDQEPDDFECDPGELCKIINESGDPFAANKPGVVPVTGTPKTVLTAIVHSVKQERPAILHLRQLADGDASNGHWVVVNGYSESDGFVRGFFLLDPWVSVRRCSDWPYTDETVNSCTAQCGVDDGCAKKTGKLTSPCVEAANIQNDAFLVGTASKFPVHSRGGNCRCHERAIPGMKPPGVIIAAWESLAAMMDTYVPPREECTCILYGTPEQRGEDQAPRPSFIRERIKATVSPGDTPISPQDALDALKRAGVRERGNYAGPWAMLSGPLPGPPVTREVGVANGKMFVLYWPENAEHLRLAARFDESGNLLGAAILKNYPVPGEEIKPEDLFRSRAHALGLDVRKILFSVSKTMHWAPDKKKSGVPWLPSYSVAVKLPDGKSETVQMEPGGRPRITIRPRNTQR
ncbi:MAG TPA: hypothetical protein VG796_27290 [Verrucomicrobiales bacterium]|nr:hypothetical protein [Verrucomicrobiales bacterium]